MENNGPPVWVFVFVALFAPLATVGAMGLQLAHDRRMRDRDTLRELLDGALQRAMELNHRLIEADGELVRLNQMVANISAGAQPSKGRVDRVQGLLNQAYADLTRSSPDTERIALLLGRRHPVYAATWALKFALIDYRQGLIDWLGDVSAGIARSTDQDPMKTETVACDDAINLFQDEVRAYLERTGKWRWWRHRAEPTVDLEVDSPNRAAIERLNRGG